MYRERDGNQDLWIFQCVNPTCKHSWTETDLTGIWIRCPKCNHHEYLNVTRIVKRKSSIIMKFSVMLALVSAAGAVSVAVCSIVRAMTGG